MSLVPKGQELPLAAVEQELWLSAQMDSVARMAQVPQLALF